MSKNDGKKDESSHVKVNPTVEVNEALTALQLPESQDNALVNQTIYALGKLFNNLENENMTRTMCLKLLPKLRQLEDIIIKIGINLEYVNTLITIFVTVDEPEEIEYTTYLLSAICKVDSCAELLCQDNIINKLFDMIVNNMDLNVKNNSLEIILGLVNCHHLRQMLAEAPSFSIKVLNTVLQGPFFVLRPVTVEILKIISNWDFDTIQIQLFDTDTISNMFDILSEPESRIVEMNALGTIYNGLKFRPVQVKCLKSENFLKYFNFARNSDSKHALTCLRLIRAFVMVPENRKVMFDLRVHEVLREFCKFNDDKIYTTFCYINGEFSKGGDIVDMTH